MNRDCVVTNLPRLKGPAAWNRILPTPPPPVNLTEPTTADITVIGAGFAGLSAARRLTQIDNSLNIVVLDADSIAEGSSGRNSGFMIDLPHELASEDYAGSGDDRKITEMNRKAIEFADGAVDEYQIDRNYFDSAGKINGAASDHAHSHNQSYANHLEKLGEPFEMLDQKQMISTTGSKHYISGLFTPGTKMLQPAGYVRGLARGLRERGVRIFENSPVVRMSKVGTGWKVICESGHVSTGKIILTVNGHLASFGFERAKLMQLFLYATMTPDLGPDSLAKLGGDPRWGVTPSNPMGTTVRRIDTGQGGNRIVTRTCATMKQNMRPTEDGLQRAANVMQHKFEQRFPSLSGMKMEYKWCGHLCLTLNSVSVMREIEDNVYSGCVQNGLGTCRGTLTGMGAAEAACGVDSEIVRYFKREPAPKRLPPRPFFQIGANLLLRWRERQAGQE